MAVAELEDVNPPYLHPAYKITVSRAPSKRLSPGAARLVSSRARAGVGARPGPPRRRWPDQQAPRPTGRSDDHAARPRAGLGRAAGAEHPGGDLAENEHVGRLPGPGRPRVHVGLDPNFTGAGRAVTDSEGRYDFRTIKPAAYPGEVGGLFRPAHIHTSLFGPLLAGRLVTQCYFEGDPLLDRDPILGSIPDPRGRERLLARFNSGDTEVGGIDSALAYDWDIVLRGPAATPLED